MDRQTYECPAIVELGTLHEQTLTWMGSAGGGFGGYPSAHNSSVSPRKFGFITLPSDDSSDDDDSFRRVKSSGSKSKHGSGGDDGGGWGGGGGSRSGGGGGGGGRGSHHGGFNVSDAFKGFGGSH